MAYNNVITRTKEQALVPEQVSNDILKILEYESAAMSLFRTIKMPTNQTRMPILAALPIAYFVNGDTGLKQTTELSWTNKYLNVEEIAAIVPIPENVLDDTSYDLWGEIKPLLAQAIARTFDAAVFFGTNAPGSWPTSIVAGATALGNTYAQGTSTAAQGGIAGDLSNTMALVEAQGFDPNGFVTLRQTRALLRNARSTLGTPLLDVGSADLGSGAPGSLGVDSVYGLPIRYAMPGLWPAQTTGNASLFTGDFTNGILGIRKDITWKILDQAVIQDNTGAIMFNLAQQDMVALRVTYRAAFQVSNLINYQQQNAALRYPWAVLTHA